MHFIGVERYWNPYLETLPPKQLRDFQFKKFKRIVEWGYKNSKLYRRLYDQAGFNPDKLQGWEDISRVPILQKEDYRTAQAKEPYPYGDSLCVPLEKVTEFHQTSGTTGQPVYQPDTWEDWEWGMKAGRSVMGDGFSKHRPGIYPSAIMYIWAPGRTLCL